MARKTVRKRRSGKSSRNNPSFSKFLTFPVLAVFAFIFLAAFTVYQVSKPSSGVKGVTATDYMFVTTAERSAIIRQAKASGEPMPTFHQLTVFRDANSNGRQSSTEVCLNKTVTFVVNNKEKTRWGCDDDITIYTKSRRATIRLKKITGFNPTGLNFIDNRNQPNATTIIDKVWPLEITVTGFPTYDAYWTVVNFGVKSNK